MADAVTSQTLVDGPAHVVMKFTNVSDGTGESAVTKVDVSALASDQNGNACTGVQIERIWWQCIGMKVQILWDATSDQFCIELGENQSGNHDYTLFGGLTNNSGSVRLVILTLRQSELRLPTRIQSSCICVNRSNHALLLQIRWLCP